LGTGFYGSNDPTNSVKAMKEVSTTEPTQFINYYLLQNFLDDIKCPCSVFAKVSL